MNTHPNTHFAALLSSKAVAKRAELRVTIERGVIMGQDITEARAQFFSLDNIEKSINYPPMESSQAEALAVLVPQWPALLGPLPEWFTTPDNVEPVSVSVQMSPTAAEDEARAADEMAQRPEE